ncbi:MAG: hypothetical protein JO076_17920, partial [Verrucomicrobia bacterium]|nr:hypothetical protein [Verrucomicrobiota bacterium]
MTTNSSALGTGNPLSGLKRRRDFFLVLTWVTSVAAVITLVAIIISILEPGLPAIQKEGLGFFTNAT